MEASRGRGRLLGVSLGFSLGVGLCAAGAAAPDPLPKPPSVSDPIRGLDLWRGAKVGMTSEQVRGLFPAAVPPRRPTVLTGGEVDRLQLAGVDLAGHAALAHFFFKNAALVSVELTLDGLVPAASQRNLGVIRSVTSRLTQTYGAGYDCGDKSFADISAYGCKWLRKPLAIRLWYMDVAGQAPLFYLAYRQADDPGYNL